MTGTSRDDAPPDALRIARRIQQQLVTGPLRAEWPAVAAALVDELLQAPLRSLLDPARVRAALQASLDRPVVEATARPLVHRAIELVLVRLSLRGERAEQFVPDRARAALDELVANPDVVPAAIVQEVMRDPAVEEVLRDVLFDALHQFSQRASPFTAEWGLPAMWKRLPSFGTGPLRRAVEAVRADFDKRLEPEIRKFLAGFSRRAARRATELSLRKQQEPQFVALRQRVVDALLKRRLEELCWSPDDPRGARLIEVLVETTTHVLVHEALLEELLRLLDRALAVHGDRPVGEVLAELGITLPHVAKMADAYWPVVAQILQSEAWTSPLALAIAEAMSDEPPG